MLPPPAPRQAARRAGLDSLESRSSGAGVCEGPEAGRDQDFLLMEPERVLLQLAAEAKAREIQVVEATGDPGKY